MYLNCFSSTCYWARCGVLSHIITDLNHFFDPFDNLEVFDLVLHQPENLIQSFRHIQLLQ